MLPPDPARWTSAERAAFDASRTSRNRALGLLLAMLALLFFGITVVRMAGKTPGAAGAAVGTGQP
jgi:hypothetical protein